MSGRVRVRGWGRSIFGLEGTKGPLSYSLSMSDLLILRNCLYLANLAHLASSPMSRLSLWAPCSWDFLSRPRVCGAIGAMSAMPPLRQVFHECIPPLRCRLYQAVRCWHTAKLSFCPSSRSQRYTVSFFGAPQSHVYAALVFFRCSVCHG